MVWALLAASLALAEPAGALAAATTASSASGGRTVWRKVSTWKAVHEGCSGGGVAEYAIKRDYLTHLADPQPATCTSGFALVPIVRAIGEEGQLVQFNSLRDYVEWRMDLEKRYVHTSIFYARTRTRTHTHTHARMHARTHARTHARARAHTHKHTHAHQDVHGPRRVAAVPARPERGQSGDRTWPRRCPERRDPVCYSRALQCVTLAHARDEGGRRRRAANANAPRPGHFLQSTLCDFME
jgi:hypothetical protein